MVLAATNRPSELDEAILRRLPQDFEIGVPERKERVEIVKVILKGETIDDNIDFDRVTSLCEGYTGSDLLELCKKAAYFPIRDLLNEEKNGKSSLKLDNNTKWWSMYACLLGFFYFFSSPFIGKTIYWKDNQTKLFKFQSKVLSIACCVFYSHCGNRAILKERTFERKNSNWFSFLKKEERNTWLAKFVRINELKDQVCSSWFAPVGSASDYPLLSKWVIYGELACNGSCPRSSDGISPIYSLWATFIGLYMANYVVERSTGWALTHPLSVEEHEKLKKRTSALTSPRISDCVLWDALTCA